jgi:hypothetical protein
MNARHASARAGAVTLASAAVVSAAMLGAPSGAAGQAVCSAPHSSPTLAQSGSIRTMYPGSGWLQVSVYGQRATEAFGPDRQRLPFLADAEFNTRSVFVTGAVGVVDGLEVWAQLPVHHLSVNASSGRSTSSGLGDVRVAARVGAELFGADLPVALRFAAKVPGSEFPVDATVLPLTEGQADLEVSLESGRALGELPLYVVAWAGYRWRTENVAAARKPGSESFAHFAVGGLAGRFSWEVAADGLWGGPPLAQGITLTQERRRLLQLFPTVGYGVGPGRLEVTGQLPLSGRNLPASYGLSAGYRISWGL